MANPFTAPQHDQDNRSLRWTHVYILKRLRIYRAMIIAYYLGLGVWLVFLTRSLLDGETLAWWKVGVVLSSFILCSCAALLVRHYRRVVEQKLERSQA